MTKYERMQKRKRERAAGAVQRKKDKDKVTNERLKEEKKAEPKKNRPASYRRDKEGNIILWGNIKVSKTSGVVLAIITSILVFFTIMGTTDFGEMDGYIEPEFSFESCQEQEFNPDMCKFHYKFCRTYADGGKICKFAAEDPWFNIEIDENRFTEEEQDFLPPTQFILPFAYATSVEDAKYEVSKIKLEIKDLYKKINEYDLERMEWKNEVRTAEKELDDAEDEWKVAKKEYRHAMDIKVQDKDDIKFQKDARDTYEDAVVQFERTEKKLVEAQRKYDDFIEKYYQAQKDMATANDSLEIALDDLTLSKIAANKQFSVGNKFINIILSRTCTTMIDNFIPTECPTYRELRDIFDNTIPKVSGAWAEEKSTWNLLNGTWTEVKGDVYREPSNYDNYWEYYNQLKQWKIITVDPDTAIQKRGVNIYIQPSSFMYTESMGSVDKTNSIVGNEQFVFHDIKYDDRCTSVIIAPDIKLITETINNIWENCTNVPEPEIFELLETPFNWVDSEYYKYQSWLDNAMNTCKERC